jgi:hypothetical protein
MLARMRELILFFLVLGISQASRSLCSGYSTTFSALGEVYAWLGEGSLEAERRACCEFAEAIADGRTVTVLPEEKRPPCSGTTSRTTTSTHQLRCVLISELFVSTSSLGTNPRNSRRSTGVVGLLVPSGPPSSASTQQALHRLHSFRRAACRQMRSASSTAARQSTGSSCPNPSKRAKPRSRPRSMPRKNSPRLGSSEALPVGHLTT